jgi:hypothetical protein
VRPHRPLKFVRAVADAPHMHPGGWSARRRLVVLCLALSVGVGFVPAGGMSAVAAGTSGAITKGESGSGVPPFPFVTQQAPQQRSATTIHWSDVPRSYWAHNAIDDVGKTNSWMRDYPQNNDGTTPFKPTRVESRKLFARAMVRAFAPNAAVDPTIHFSDLPDDAPFYQFANVVVQKGWMHAPDGAFLPGDGVTMALVHHAIVYALGLRAAANGLNHIHTHNGFVFHTPDNFGSTLIGMRLGLRFNHSDESLDVHPVDLLPRAEVAWSLYRATTLPSYAISDMEPYATIELPTIGPKKQALIQWGIDFVGYPYVWGGEWDTATRSGYCCGSQPIGGFDCSGLTWWIMKHAGGGWDNRPPRPYGGWSLPQRTSHDMATVGDIHWRHLQVGDINFYDGNDDGVVDHVDTYIGNGWALDSSSTPAGVTIMWVGTGWYRDHFVHARRIIG